MTDQSATAKGLPDGTILISAHGEKLIVYAAEAKELMRQLVLALIEAKLALKRRQGQQRDQ